MVSKLTRKETERILKDFGIEEVKIPRSIKTDGDVERWRKDMISKHLDMIEKEELAV